MLVGAQLLNVRMLQALGVSLVAMAAISAAVFEFVIKGGVKTVMERGHVTVTKGEEYETTLDVQLRGGGWVDTALTTFEVEAGQQMQIETFSGGKVRLRFLGMYAGRTEGVKVGITLHDPLNLESRLEEVVYPDFVLDTLPASLFAPTVPKRRRVYGFGEQPTGYSGAGQELYGLEEYNMETDTKNVIWKRVAKSQDESLIAGVREAGVRDVVRVGVVQFAERGDARAAWIDQLCEALGQVGRQVLAIGPKVSVNFNSPLKTEPGSEGKESGGERLSGITSLRAADVIDLTEAVMSCSVASPSQNIEEVVDNSDLVVTGLKELEDYQMATLIVQKPLLVIPEEASPLPGFTEGAVVWSEKQNLLPMIQRIVES
jgi:hypothetical protein